MVQISEIADPFERFVNFIQEREDIRRLKEAGEPFPWTQDPILQFYRFTNVNRENDKVSKHYQKTVRTRYQNSLVIPGTVMYRWFNRIEICDAFFNEPDFSNHSAFERYMDEKDPGILLHVLNQLPPPHVTGAFIITGRPGLPKSIGVVDYFHQWCTHHDWGEMYQGWQEEPSFLSVIYDLLKGEGLGSFMTAQLVADLKYLPCLHSAPDWQTWAASGPGSRRGLNVLSGRGMDAPWNEKEWHEKLLELRGKVNPHLTYADIEPLHAQDLQNCLCEFSKYEKVRTGLGRPRQVYHV